MYKLHAIHSHAATVEHLCSVQIKPGDADCVPKKIIFYVPLMSFGVKTQTRQIKQRRVTHRKTWEELKPLYQKRLMNAMRNNYCTLILVLNLKFTFSIISA